MKHAIGIDLGGTFIKYGLIAEGQTVFNLEGKVPTFAKESKEKIIEQISKAVNICLDYAKENDLEVNAIGLGTPGIVDETNGVIIGGAENLKDWVNIPIALILKEQTGLPVTLSNDANMMALGETAYGAARGYSDVVFLTIGTGVGGGLIINNNLYGGFANRGTELGHIPINIFGPKCSAGCDGCLEAYASTSALLEQYKDNLKFASKDIPADVTGEYLIKEYKNNDPVAVETMNEHWNYLGHGVAAFINIFSPQAIVIGGGISDAGDFYVEEIAKVAFKKCMPQCSVNTKILKAVLGNKAAILGAAAKAFKLT